MIIILDTETTGLHPEDGDELLQVSIIDYDKNVLFDRYIKPKFHSSWKEAEAVNHITPDMVRDAPTIDELRDELSVLINSADIIIGYNTPYDLRFLDFCADIRPTPGQKIIDDMERFKEAFGFAKWIKLVEAADLLGYDWDGSGIAAHNSLGDVYATLHVHKKLNDFEQLKELDADWRRRHGG